MKHYQSIFKGWTACGLVDAKETTELTYDVECRKCRNTKEWKDDDQRRRRGLRRAAKRDPFAGTPFEPHFGEPIQ